MSLATATNSFLRFSDKSNDSEGASGFILKLFQMVNEASDEVISWTPSGDAFIIGKNLQQLENETLPQFFRHNRFQSLVRQLNFYSFRKINKERHVWIYKHPLFHRDHPEDLCLVKRRTCPGMDGRKVRMSRLSARRLSNGQVSDDSSTDGSIEELKRYRDLTGPLEEIRDIKRSRSLSTDADSEDRKGNPTEQSIIVSEVASKLEEYARKAGHGLPRRRGSSGIVTPSYSSMKSFSEPVISYDDEYPFNEDPHPFTTNDHRRDSLGLIAYADDVSVNDESLASLDSIPEEQVIAQNYSTPIVTKSTSDQLRHRLGSVDKSSPFYVHSRVALFCISNGSPDLESLAEDILDILQSCEELAQEFDMYQSALLPGKIPMEQWAIGARSEMVRTFRTFAVNSIRSIFASTEQFLWSESERTVLQVTELAWSGIMA